MRPFRVLLKTVCVWTLLVACSNQKQVVASINSPSGAVQIQDTVGHVEQLMLDGHWLVWRYVTESPDDTRPLQAGFAVYDLAAQRLVYTDTAGSNPIHMVDGSLYYARQLDPQWYDKQPMPNENGWGLNRLDLNTLQDAQLLANVPSVETDGQLAAWSLPDTCRPFTACPLTYPTTCHAPARRLYVDNLVTGKALDLGTYASNAFVADVSDGVVYVGYTSTSCSIKASDGPYNALDLQANETREVVPLTVSPETATLWEVLGRRVLIEWGTNRTVILDVPGHGDSQVVLNAYAGRPLGLAGRAVLLYAPVIRELATPSSPLVALNLENGDTQQLAVGDPAVWRAAGDAQYAAWVNYKNELYWAELHLAPSGQPTLLNTPAPTLEWNFPSLHPSRMGTPAPLVTPIVQPTGTAVP
jgi:hypothetical protein